VAGPDTGVIRKSHKFGLDAADEPVQRSPLQIGAPRVTHKQGVTAKQMPGHQKTAGARGVPRRVKHPDHCFAQLKALIIAKQPVRHGVHR